VSSPEDGQARHGKCRDQRALAVETLAHDRPGTFPADERPGVEGHAAGQPLRVQRPEHPEARMDDLVGRQPGATAEGGHAGSPIHRHVTPASIRIARHLLIEDRCISFRSS
jgi:hypothetical protein